MTKFFFAFLWTDTCDRLATHPRLVAILTKWLHANEALLSDCVYTDFKGATSRFVHLEKFSLNFSSWSFAIRVNLLHP